MKPQTYYIYIAECADNTLYIGITPDLFNRSRAHNGQKTGGALYTKWRRPVGIRYTELWASKSEAMTRERQLKKLKRADKIIMCDHVSCSMRF